MPVDSPVVALIRMWTWAPLANSYRDIYVVGDAHRGERTTFITPVRHVDLGHGHDPALWPTQRIMDS